MKSSNYKLVWVVAGTMFGGGGDFHGMHCAPHSGSLGVLGWGLWHSSHSSYGSIQHFLAGGCPY